MTACVKRPHARSAPLQLYVNDNPLARRRQQPFAEAWKRHQRQSRAFYNLSRWLSPRIDKEFLTPGLQNPIGGIGSLRMTSQTATETYLTKDSMPLPVSSCHTDTAADATHTGPRRFLPRDCICITCAMTRATQSQPSSPPVRAPPMSIARQPPSRSAQRRSVSSSLAAPRLDGTDACSLQRSQAPRGRPVSA